MKKQQLQRIMIRTDGIKKFSPSINNASLNNSLIKEIEKLFELGYVVFVMHPGNIYRNFHSLNIMRDENRLVIEVVGPGFLATDLNRDGILHECIEFNLPIMDKASRRLLTSNSEYHKQIVVKIRHLGEKKAKENKSYLLKYSKYVPLTFEEISYVKNCFPKLIKASKYLQTKSKNWISSMSFLDLGKGINQPIFWDMYYLS
jgi:hypothetical protein